MVKNLIRDVFLFTFACYFSYLSIGSALGLVRWACWQLGGGEEIEFIGVAESVEKRIVRGKHSSSEEHFIVVRNSEKLIKLELAEINSIKNRVFKSVFGQGSDIRFYYKPSITSNDDEKITSIENVTGDIVYYTRKNHYSPFVYLMLYTFYFLFMAFLLVFSLFMYRFIYHSVRESVTNIMDNNKTK